MGRSALHCYVLKFCAAIRSRGAARREILSKCVRPNRVATRPFFYNFLHTVCLIILGCGFDPPNPPKIIPKWGPNFGVPGLFFDFGRPCRPRWPQWRQKCPQGLPNRPQNRTKEAPRRPKMPPEGPERSKGIKRCQQDAPAETSKKQNRIKDATRYETNGQKTSR